MTDELPFTSSHIASLAACAAELERIGEEVQDPHTLVRAARLYTLAVRVADDIDDREALPFMRSDLARVHDELRRMTNADAPNDSRGAIIEMFREIAVRIEQRLAQTESGQAATGT